MHPKSKISPLLNSVIKDNPTFKFPVGTISKELVAMFLDQNEFEYFTIQAYRKLKTEYGSTIAHIFLTVMDIKLSLKERDIFTLTSEQYTVEMESFLNTLDQIYITKVDKKSPDGEMMAAML